MMATPPPHAEALQQGLEMLEDPRWALYMRRLRDALPEDLGRRLAAVTDAELLVVFGWSGHIARELRLQ